MIKVKCPNCGKSFRSNSHQEKYKCKNCGVIINAGKDLLTGETSYWGIIE